MVRDAEAFLLVKESGGAIMPRLTTLVEVGRIAVDTIEVSRRQGVRHTVRAR